MKFFALGFVLALICLLPLHAQTATTAPADPECSGGNTNTDSPSAE
jgi:hypothetical protein